jgi:hypothetical protein
MAGWGSVVPPGLESFLPVFPALKRWANFFSPLRGWILDFVPPDCPKNVHREDVEL